MVVFQDGRCRLSHMSKTFSIGARCSYPTDNRRTLYPSRKIFKSNALCGRALYCCKMSFKYLQTIWIRSEVKVVCAVDWTFECHFRCYNSITQWKMQHWIWLSVYTLMIVSSTEGKMGHFADSHISPIRHFECRGTKISLLHQCWVIHL